MRTWLSVGLLSVWLSTVGAQPQPVPLPAPVPEAAMKAHYVLNFMRYVSWPGDLMPPRADRALTLCILGTDAVGTTAALMALERKGVENVPVVSVLRVSNVRGVQGCHAVFVAESEAHKIDHILDSLGSSPVLVVADAPVAQGATVVLSQQDRRLVFDINLTRAKATQLQVSSKLLQLARFTR
jgi:hypothetical protein